MIDKRSHGMETAALVLALISISTCTCIYLSIHLGALAVMFALLSKGGETALNSKSKLALCLGIAGMVLTALLYTFSFLTLLREYGSLQGIMDAYTQMTGIDYNELIEEMYSTY